MVVSTTICLVLTYVLIAYVKFKNKEYLWKQKKYIFFGVDTYHILPWFNNKTSWWKFWLYPSIFATPVKNPINPKEYKKIWDNISKNVPIPEKKKSFRVLYMNAHGGQGIGKENQLKLKKLLKVQADIIIFLEFRASIHNASNTGKLVNVVDVSDEELVRFKIPQDTLPSIPGGPELLSGTGKPLYGMYAESTIENVKPLPYQEKQKNETDIFFQGMFKRLKYYWQYFYSPKDCPFGKNWGQCFMSLEQPDEVYKLDLQTFDDKIFQGKITKESRALTAIRFGSIIHATVHLENQNNPIGRKIRINQSKEVANWVRKQKEKGYEVILMGDLNSYDLSRLSDETKKQMMDLWYPKFGEGEKIPSEAWTNISKELSDYTTDFSNSSIFIKHPDCVFSTIPGEVHSKPFEGSDHSYFIFDY